MIFYDIFLENVLVNMNNEIILSNKIFQFRK